MDADAADKATRFMNLCDVFDVPVLLLCDCPGFMVGIESEAQGALRHMCRMLVLGGSMTVPIGVEVKVIIIPPCLCYIGNYS